MQTILYKIEFKDGRIYKVYCANLTQIKKIQALKHKTFIKEIKELTCGIHTTKQVLEIFNNICKND